MGGAKGVFSQDPPRLYFHLTQCGDNPSALYQPACYVLQPLRKGVGVVRVRVDYAISAKNCGKSAPSNI